MCLFFCSLHAHLSAWFVFMSFLQRLLTLFVDLATQNTIFMALRIECLFFFSYFFLSLFVVCECFCISYFVEARQQKMDLCQWMKGLFLLAYVVQYQHILVPKCNRESLTHSSSAKTQTLSPPICPRCRPLRYLHTIQNKYDLTCDIHFVILPYVYLSICQPKYVSGFASKRDVQICLSPVSQ